MDITAKLNYSYDSGIGREISNMFGRRDGKLGSILRSAFDRHRIREIRVTEKNN